VPRSAICRSHLQLVAPATESGPVDVRSVLEELLEAFEEAERKLATLPGGETSLRVVSGLRAVLLRLLRREPGSPGGQG
jgi:hypothetical protein